MEYSTYSMVAMVWVSLITLLYLFVRNKFNFWAKLGVHGPPPKLTSFGNIVDIASSSDPMKCEIDLINKYGLVYGTYTGLQPVLTIADADLIKQIMVKDFNLFTNRRPFGGDYSMIAINQFFAENDKWRRLRAIARPNFTASKLREMLPLMTKCVENLNTYLGGLAKGDGIMKVNEIMSGFTIDAICSIAFGTETHANTDRSKENPVVVRGMKFFDINPLKGLIFLTTPTWFSRLCGVHHYFNDESLTYFCALMREVIKQRKDGSINRKDFVKLLLETEIDEEELKSLKLDKNFDGQALTKLTEEEVVAQCVLFFAAGYETSAMTTMNIVWELTMNQDVQEQLYQDLKEALDGVKLNSEEYNEIVLNKLPYLEAVIKETLRKYPTSNRMVLDRRFNGDSYVMNGIPIKTNQVVDIPILAIHYNPEYHPDPERFNPLRFMPENKDNINPYTFLSFGAGPRNCIGLRYALQEIKLCFARIVHQYKFTPTKDTPVKLQYKPFKFTLSPQPFTVKVTPRNA